MFYNALSFNQDISNWNLEKLKNARDMFHNAKSFNQDLESWNMPSLKTMDRMFLKSGMQKILSWYKEEWQKEQEIKYINKHFIPNDKGI